MEKKVGRNDLCPCGSGKKFKQCCMKHPTATGKKKFTAKLISGGTTKAPDLMERTFGTAIASSHYQTPPSPAEDPKEPEEGKEG